MTFGVAHAHYIRALLRVLFDFRERPRHEDRVMVLILGAPIDADQPNPTQGNPVMANGNVGQRIPLVLKVYQADGATPAVFDGDPVWSSDDESVVEVRSVEGVEYAYLMSFGATNVGVTIDADRGEGVRSLTAVAQVLVNDPSSEAQIIAIELGEAEDVPA